MALIRPNKGYKTLMITYTPELERLHSKEKCKAIALDMHKFKKLYNLFVKSLDTYLEYFRDASLNTLESAFTDQVYNSLGSILVDENRFANTNLLNFETFMRLYKQDNVLFSNYKLSFHKVLDGLHRAIQLHLTNVNQKSRILTLEEKEKILNDADLLNEYIRSMNDTFFLFDVKKSVETVPGLKPQYLEYFKRHGPPIDGIFESEKLAVIIKELVDNGTLDANDVFDDLRI